MPQSEQIGDLAKALAETQAEMQAPKKAHVGKIKGTAKSGSAYEYEYRYADLADVIECRKVGAKHGLAITQGMEMREGYLALTTTLMHSTGQWKAWECPIPAGLKPQELGSYLTYMRRYSECCTWGIAAEDDDDGKAAQGANGEKAEKPKPAAAPKPAEAKPPVLSVDERLKITALAKSRGILTPAAFADFLRGQCQESRTAAELSKTEYAMVTDVLLAMPEKKASAA